MRSVDVVHLDLFVSGWTKMFICNEKLEFKYFSVFFLFCVHFSNWLSYLLLMHYFYLSCVPLRCFSRFLNCANRNKLHNVIHSTFHLIFNGKREIIKDLEILGKYMKRSHVLFFILQYFNFCWSYTILQTSEVIFQRFYWNLR